MTDSPPSLIAKLNELLALPMENEVVEFKQAKDSFDIRKLGTYLSALANEANLLGKTEGWLILGVDNSRRIVGTNLYQGLERRESIKHEVIQRRELRSPTCSRSTIPPEGCSCSECRPLRVEFPSRTMVTGMPARAKAWARWATRRNNASAANRP